MTERPILFSAPMVQAILAAATKLLEEATKQPELTPEQRARVEKIIQERGLRSS